MPAQVAKYPVAWTECNGGKWLPPASCCLPDEACTADALLADVLAREGIPMVTGFPPWLRKLWLAHMPGVKIISPSTVRAHLRFRGQHLALMQSPSDEGLQVLHKLITAASVSMRSNSSKT